jgi:hypothetical protein
MGLISVRSDTIPEVGAQLRVLLHVYTCAHRAGESNEADDADDCIVDVVHMVYLLIEI